MARYKAHAKRGRLPGRITRIMAIAILLILIGVVGVRNIYSHGLKPVSNSPKSQVFVVKQGSTLKQISENLQHQHLIRSAWAMGLYVHSKELGDKLQAGTYALSPNLGTKVIVTKLTQGTVSKKLVTILPGRRIDQLRADFINDGFKPDDVDQALLPDQYKDLPVMSYKPATITTLEGLLWPDSYQKDQTTQPQVIVREALQAMGDHLTPDVQAAFASQGLTTYQGVILSSIVLQEVSKPADQSQAAQVFLSRLKMNMNLGSDATTRYGSIIVGLAPSLTYDSAYNTLQHPGLPPTPISTINASSLAAAGHPAGTNWLYFVSGDDGTTYFSTNLQDHEALTQQHCHKLCDAGF